ncbi:MAG TPA: ribonuclease P protein component, partial [Edaphobacter sp.]
VSPREPKAADDSAAPRVGLTVGKVMGKAVDRNRIKRRMREAVRRNIATLQGPIDIVLHPRRSVIDLDFALLDREIAQVFQTIRGQAIKGHFPPPQPDTRGSSPRPRRPAPRTTPPSPPKPTPESCGS